jgi:glutamyl endopeptidase
MTDTSRPSVLVVDDETGILDSLNILLRNEGFAPEIAHGGKAGLDRIAERAPDIVLTAGHCLYDFENKRWAANVTVSPGRTSKLCPFGRCKSVRLFTTRGWKEGRAEEYDYGAIKLDCSIGNQTGWLGYDPAPDGVTDSTPLRLLGYAHYRKNLFGDAEPQPPAIQDMVASAKLIQPRLIFYPHDTDKNDSGAPLFTADLRVRIVHNMGCHALPGDPPLVDGGRQCATSGSDHARLNHGVRITDRVAANLAAWRHAR